VAALKTNGTLWTWGRNNFGQLGNGTNTNVSIATQIGTDTDWQSVATGSNHTMAIKNNGTLWGWGSNSAYQLGDGTFVNKNVPTQMGTYTNWQSIKAGSSSTLGVKSNNALYTWGAGSYGQIGNQQNTTRVSPFQVPCVTVLGNDEMVSDKPFSIYPNPVKELLHLHAPSLAIDKIIIYDATGKKIVEQNSNVSTINVSNLQRGIYLLHLFIGEKMYTEKFIRN